MNIEAIAAAQFKSHDVSYDEYAGTNHAAVVAMQYLSEHTDFYEFRDALKAARAAAGIQS